MTQVKNKLVIPSLEENINKDRDVVLISNRISKLQRNLIDISFVQIKDRAQDFGHKLNALHTCQQIHAELIEE